MELSGYFSRFRLFRELGELLRNRNIRLSDNFYLNLLAVATGIIVGLLVYAWSWFLELGNGFLRGDGDFPQWSVIAGLPWLATRLTAWQAPPSPSPLSFAIALGACAYALQQLD